MPRCRQAGFLRRRYFAAFRKFSSALESEAAESATLSFVGEGHRSRRASIISATLLWSVLGFLRPRSVANRWLAENSSTRIVSFHGFDFGEVEQVVDQIGKPRAALRMNVTCRSCSSASGPSVRSSKIGRG